MTTTTNPDHEQVQPELDAFIERLTILAERKPTTLRLLDKLFELIEQTDQVSLDATLEYFQFCQKQPEIALLLATASHVLGNGHASDDPANH